jgi:outer membrane protein OmpA-like peptidoglycan-associated protein
MKRIRLLLTIFSLGISAISLAQVRRSLGAPVNTEQFTEYAPSISADNNLLIFETDRGPNGKWELYYSTKNDKKKWLAPKPIIPINSQGKDNDLIGGPSISYDGKTLYFFASFDGGKGDMDLYSSAWDGKDWTAPKSLGDNINTARYEGFPSISADGKRLFFIRDNFSKRKDKETCYTIWMSNKQEDGTWGVAEKLPAPVNMDCEKSPRIMADGRTLIFSSVRKDGVGSFDLYQSIQEDDGSWTAPENLEYINTEEADQFASVSATGDLMYYQNTGDIYTVTIPDKYRKYKLLTLSGVIQDAITKKAIKTKLSIKSSNTKERPSISAIGDDGKYIVVLRVGTKYTFTANYPDYLPYNGTVDLSQAKENTEITQNINLVPTKLPFQFQLLDKDTKAVLKEPKVRIIEAETKTPVTVTVEGDMAKADLKMNVAYKFSAGAAGYGFFARGFKPDSSDAFKDRTKRIPLAALKKDVVVQLNDITFETAKAELKPDSFEELDRLIKMLEDSPNVKCEISAHTDDVGNDDYNLKLSDKRAKSVVDYLASKGIKTERMIPKGYGETQPLVANDTDENKAKNRRVQFKIVN